ncbi:MAG: enoyl-CoA hydratase-related protein [Bacteroidota bacterium]
MTLIEKRDNQIGILQFNRPEVYNSINADLATRLLAALDALQVDPTIRAVMITGTGKAFCAGQDLQEAISPGFEIGDVVEDYYNAIVRRIRNLSKPVIAAVNGIAAGAGANIALACDITVANSSAHFVQAFSGIGLVPDSGGTFMLPRSVGFAKASALMMLGEKVPAAEAEQMGMIYKVFDPEKFEAQALELASRLAGMPTKALAFTKQLLNESHQNSLEEQLAMEKEFQIKATKTSDHKEGIQAFIEKRKPKFTGE